MNQKFKIGDQVYHKSGRGPTMAVRGYEEEQVICEWFDQNNNLNEKAFPEDILEHYKPAEVFISRKKRQNHY